MTEIRFTVPLVPPSVNHYVKHTRSGRHYVTKEAIAFKDAIALFSKGYGVDSERHEVSLQVYFGKGQRGDIDNLAKCVFDGLVCAGVLKSDASIYRLTVSKDRDWTNPRTEIIVRGLE